MHCLCVCALDFKTAAHSAFAGTVLPIAARTVHTLPIVAHH